jgi:hypothetical protein
MYRADDLVGRPAAMERFIVELLEDPIPPQVSMAFLFLNLKRICGKAKTSKSKTTKLILLDSLLQEIASNATMMNGLIIEKMAA